MNPNTVNADGTCPSCGRLVDPGRARAAAPASVVGGDAPEVDPRSADGVGEGPEANEEADEDEEYHAPWHFWVMVVGVVLYLGWRLVEALIWGWDRLF